MENDDTETAASSSSTRRPATRGATAYARSRGNTACQVCRARRTKCDRALPKCSFCQKTGANCVRSSVDLSSFDPASLQILERIEDLSHQFRTWSSQQTSTATENADGLSLRQATSARIVCEQSWLFPQSAEQVLSCHGPRIPLLTMLKSSNESTPGSIYADSPLSSLADLEPQSTRGLTDRFFSHVHVKNPILDEQSTKTLVARLALHGVDWSPQCCLILLVCALGSLATPLGPSPGTAAGTAAYTNAHSYFLAAQKRLGSCLVKGGLVEAQCLFLAGVYLMAIFKPFEAWRMFSQALASCQDFGFLVDGELSDYGISGNSWSSSMVAEQAVYWSAWKSEQELRSNLRPPDFCSQVAVELPKFFPTPPDPTETDTEQQVMAWTFYLTEISLRRQVLMIAADIQETVGRSPQFDAERLLEMLPSRLAQIEDWLRAIPSPISLQPPIDGDNICNFVLRGQVLDLYEMLYCPFLNIALAHTGEPEQTYDFRDESVMQNRRAQIRLLAEKALALHVERIQVNKPGFYHRHHGTWFLLRSCSRSATMILKAAIHNQRVHRPIDSLSLPDGWDRAVLNVIELHHHWKTEASDAWFRVETLERMHSEAVQR